MAQGDFFVKTETAVAAGSAMTITGADAETGAVELHTLASSGAVDVFAERNTTGDADDTFDSSVSIASASGEFHSQKNKIELSNGKNMRIRLQNTSGDANDIQVTGIEVSS